MNHCTGLQVFLGVALALCFIANILQAAFAVWQHNIILQCKAALEETTGKTIEELAR